MEKKVFEPIEMEIQVLHDIVITSVTYDKEDYTLPSHVWNGNVPR